MIRNADEKSLFSEAWYPTPEDISGANVTWLMQQVGARTYQNLHSWSVAARDEYWKLVVERLKIRFRQPYTSVLDLSTGVEDPQWFPGSELNIAESCFNAPADTPAILHQAEGGPIEVMTVGELNTLSDRVAANLARIGITQGAAVAIMMPMTAESVAIYLGIVKAGCAVVGIADSFQPKEIATRLRLSEATAIFTQDVMIRGGKKFPLYENVVQANGPRIIVLPGQNAPACQLRSSDLHWNDFLQTTGPFTAVAGSPNAISNILFSSGTTGDPKVIPWTHLTPLKCAADGHFHQNIHSGDVVVWPTNIGWMMGPWLIYASLINQATMALFNGAPTGQAFGRFVQDVKANVVGVVPSLVGTWRHSGCLEGLDWSSIRLFSSTGECSCPEDMAWLMRRPGHVPVIEYCGGTEIGGGYIASTVTLPCVPGTFNTPTLGIDLCLINDQGKPAEQGEVFLVPPSIGMSTRLLNRSHHAVYYEGTPVGKRGEVLRRHGDEMKKLPGGYWRALGRADDTMNLGGIKVSSAEIEQVLNGVPDVIETAAIAVAPTDGPSQLVVYAVCRKSETFKQDETRTALQNAIRRDLNPLFKIHDVMFVDALPRTASNKVMRRVLRDEYLKRGE